jgi:trigger factor
MDAAMQVVETKTEGLKREFKVAVPAGEIEAKVAERLGEIARTAQLPGFRPGKAPLALLRKRFGAAVMGEVLDRAVDDTSRRAFDERGLRPAGTPKIEITSFKEGSDLEYTMVLEVMPDVPPIDFAGLKIERLVAEVEDSDVDRVVQRLAEQRKETRPAAEARKSRAGDTLVVDFVGRAEGKDLPGGTAEGYHLELGSKMFLPGFEDQLVGVGAGDKMQVRVTMPDAYGPELAGKEAVFEVTVKELREAVPAAVDDELARKLGFAELGALKAAAREQQQRELKAISRGRLKRSLLDALARAHAFEVPPGMVDSEFESIWNEYRQHVRAGTETEAPGKSEDELKAEYRGIAERRVRLGILLAEVGRLNNIRVSQEDMNRRMIEEARRHPGQEQAVMDYLKKTPAAQQVLMAPLYEDKVVDFILEMAEVSERKVSVEELLKEPLDGEEASPAKAAAPADGA